MAEQYPEIMMDMPIELMTEEESSAYRDLFPETERSHDENLAEHLDEKQLNKLATDTINWFEQDEASRKDWLYRERHGIRLLGISENVVDAAPFEGASQVTYPGLIEAIIQFQSRAVAELWPPEGPVKVYPLSKINKEQDKQSYRVQQYMNYLYTEKMPGAFEEQDKMLFRIPLSGSAFIKSCYDPLEGCIVRKYIATDDFVVPYSASDLRSTPRWTHVLRYTKNDLDKLQAQGFYVKHNLRIASDDNAAQDRTLKDEIDAVESRDRLIAYDDNGPNVVYEQFCYLDIENKEVSLPYIVHTDKENQKVLAIYRDWEEGDPKYRPIEHIAHYKFLPGLGFYGLGYLHILSSLAHAQTGSIRSLLDSAQFANLQGGFTSLDLKIQKDEIPISPGEWIRVNAISEELSKGFFPLPFKEPSQTLFNLHTFLDDVFRRVAGTTEVTVGDAPNNAPVGTTLALIEQSQRVQTAVHIRLHQAAKTEFKIVQKLIYKYFDQLESEEGSYTQLVDPELTVDDFDGRVDIIPVSDPNVISSAQRIAMAQAILQLSEQAPDLYNKEAVHRRLLEAMRIYDLEEILMSSSEVPARDPLTENMAIMTNKPVQAFIEQDHDAHIAVLDSWFNTTDPETRRQTSSTYYAHRAEHIAFKYQIQMMQLMGIPEIPEDLSPEDQAVLTSMAAQASQLMGQMQPEESDPKAEETQADIHLKTQKTLADIARKDAESSARVKREDSLAVAKQAREIQELEHDLIEKSISDDLEKAANLGQ